MELILLILSVIFFVTGLLAPLFFGWVGFLVMLALWFIGLILGMAWYFVNTIEDQLNGEDKLDTKVKKVKTIKDK